ncbi:MAG: pyruvate kinase [Planctomycetales bacterium]|nr:pyruvate kinase [Planctomycetales bacterium]
MPLHRRTKIIATVGPACDSVEMLQKLIVAGVNIFRLNMAHGDLSSHSSRVYRIREAAEASGMPVGILADLAGPKLRLGRLAVDALECQAGDELLLTRGKVTTEPNVLVSEYEALLDEIQAGDRIIIGDGTVALEVRSSNSQQAECVVVDGGTIRGRQGIALPNTRLSIETIGPKDYEHADWATILNLDYVSLSFVRNQEDIHQLRQFLKSKGSHAAIIAKIEKRESLDVLDEIVQAADGIMVARGDLGLEVDIATTAVVQKRIIDSCRVENKPVIVATQMLESMHHAKRPTRAEVSDVSNAILDGTDACMLSGETAVGQYPEDAVKMMSRIISEAERLVPESILKARPDKSRHGDITEAVLQGATQISRGIGSQVVVVVTKSGRSAMLRSKLRDKTTTLCLTDSDKVAGQACLWWGVYPFHIDSVEDEGAISAAISKWNDMAGVINSGDRVVIVSDRRAYPQGHDSILVLEIP